ncbi:hypothetical protein [Halolamina salifodinae]|uniref:Uncharacterized protein n=1 Tax=Halolamina salifodinae TaxID=1202767 RepID=A0A8T4GW82_9EURY|nr:hypothetical protein [Halolamina salifodinae]MBP1985944.1 hypothetical protein [Halolamina salifodinae]
MPKGSRTDQGGEGGGLINVVTSWGDLSVPDSLSNLSDVSGQLVSFVMDQSYRRQLIVGTMLSWFLEELFGFVTAVVALALQAVGQAASVPTMLVGYVISLGDAIGGGLFGLGSGLASPVIGLIDAMGWTAPLMAALVFLIVIESAEEVVPALIPALTDLLGAVPVIGSLLDAALTFVWGLLGGDSS